MPQRFLYVYKKKKKYVSCYKQTGISMYYIISQNERSKKGLIIFLLLYINIYLLYTLCLILCILHYFLFIAPVYKIIHFLIYLEMVSIIILAILGKGMLIVYTFQMELKYNFR